jgi:hypothetical protein
MNNFSYYFNKAYSALAAISFDSLALILICAFVGIFVFALILSLISQKVKVADKRPFFHLLNVFTALALALFISEWEQGKAIASAAIFWCFGYILYGVLCAVTPKVKTQKDVNGITLSSIPAMPPRENIYPDIPAAKNSVRLEHSLSIADKLLLKNLGKGDRQELEKMKSTLTVLQIKGSLTPQEGEILNDIFNALLKLMAKYNL